MKKFTLLLSFLFVISCSKDPITYTLITSSFPADAGSISPSTSEYEPGQTVNIIAFPNSEHNFDSWSGALGLSNNTSVIMNSDKLVVANFIKKEYKLTLNYEGKGTVSKEIIKYGSATDYTIGSVIELTAIPNDKWLFVEWKGDVTGTENPTQIIIDKSKSVTAVFVKS